MQPTVPLNRRLRVIVLPNRAWSADRQAYRPGEAPDPDRLRRLLAERGIDFISIDPFRPPYNPWGRGHPFFAGIDVMRALMVLLRHRSVDLVVSVFESSAVVLLLLRRPFLFRPPVAMWDASVGSDWFPRRLALRLTLPRVDRFFSLTRWQKSIAEKQFRLRESGEVIGYAVDESFYRPAEACNARYVLSVGEDPARDYATLIGAVHEMPIEVVVKTRRAVTQPAGGAVRLTIMQERVSDLRLRQLYAEASIIVIPLYPSATPSGITTLFEAMAMAKPIIASDVPMIREFITHEETGFLVPAGDAGALRQALEFLLARPDERERLGANARIRLMADGTQAALADRLETCIRSMVVGSSDPVSKHH